MRLGSARPWRSIGVNRSVMIVSLDGSWSVAGAGGAKQSRRTRTWAAFATASLINIFHGVKFRERHSRVAASHLQAFRWALRNLTVSGRLVAAPPVSATPGISMFDDPSGAGTAIFRSPLSGIVPAPSRVLLSPYLSGTKRSAFQPVCALSRDSATGRADRFRRRRSALSYSPTIAAIGVQASPGNSAEVCRSTSTLSKLDCLRRSRTPAPLAARRWTLQKRGLWKPARATA